MSRKILLISTYAICLTLFGCRSGTKNYPVEFVNRNNIASFDKNLTPLLLVVEIKEDGKLSLNKIETGTIANLGAFSEKIRAIFDDRANNGITEREVFINRTGEVKNDDLNKVIEVLKNLKAMPIRVITEG